MIKGDDGQTFGDPLTPFTSSKSQAPLFLTGALISAAVGQAFLAQSDLPWTLIPGLLGYLLALFFLYRIPVSRPAFSMNPLSFRAELFFFFLNLAIAFGLRIYNIDSLPSGMHVDQGFMGEQALRLTHEGLQPFLDIFTFHSSSYLLYFTSAALAVWFRCVGASYFSFHFFYVLFALAAFPFIYWTFRQLAGSKVALFSIFLLAVMRWHITFSRNGFPCIQMPYYSFIAIALWLYWLNKKNIYCLLGSALACGIGLYTYQAFKTVPLCMLALGLYEYGNRGVKIRHLAAYFGVLLLVTAPLLACTLAEKGIGYRENSLFILNEVKKEESLKPVWDNWEKTGLMFNREGDGNPRHNIPGRRMLDDGTGILWVLGLGLLWRYRREPRGFYGLSGLVFFSLPCLLSVDAAHANRMLGVTPWIAFTAATALTALEDWFRIFWKSRIHLVQTGLIFLFILIPAQNVFSYFVEQAGNDQCWKENGVAQTFIGQKIRLLEEKEPGRLRFLITPTYFDNETIGFLTAGNEKDLLEFQPSQLLKNELPRDRDVFFVLEEGKSGVFEFLKLLFPKGQETLLQDRQGHTLVYFYEVQKAELDSFRGWDRGLIGRYYSSLQDSGPPALVRTDPLLNLTSWKDFPLPPTSNFSICWTGTLSVPESGVYGLRALTFDWSEIKMDGRRVFSTDGLLPGSVKLKKGPHPIQVEYQNRKGQPPVFHLVWIRPGLDSWEVIPADSFGELSP
jgi:hypothetical protein